MSKVFELDWYWMFNQAALWGTLICAVRFKVWRQYQYFLLYLLASAIVSALLLYFRVNKDAQNYGHYFVLWGYIAPVFIMLAISELIRSTLSHYSAIAAAYKILLRFLFAGLIIFGLSWYAYLSSNSSIPFPLLSAALSFQQTATMSFALFLLIFLSFLAIMNVPMQTSRLVHAFVLSSIFFAMATGRLMYLLSENAGARVWGSNVSTLGSAIALLVWMAKVRADANVESLATVRGSLNPEEVEAHLLRMGELNRSLARSFPKFLQ
jgi:hypothetical protein